MYSKFVCFWLICLFAFPHYLFNHLEKFLICFNAKASYLLVFESEHALKCMKHSSLSVGKQRLRLNLPGEQFARF